MQIFSLAKVIEQELAEGLLESVGGRRPALLGNLPTEILHDALQLLQARRNLILHTAISVSVGAAACICPPGLVCRWEDTGDVVLDAVVAGLAPVAADLASVAY